MGWRGGVGEAMWAAKRQTPIAAEAVHICQVHAGANCASEPMCKDPFSALPRSGQQKRRCLDLRINSPATRISPVTGRKTAPPSEEFAQPGLSGRGLLRWQAASTRASSINSRWQVRFAGILAFTTDRRAQGMKRCALGPDVPTIGARRKDPSRLTFALCASE